MRYKTILADPPWPEKGAGKIKRGADRWYPLLSIKEITAMAPFIRSLADPAGCHLYLWATNNHLHDAMHVMEAWGFRYITCITWVKDRIGLGQYFRGQTEHCLFGVMGKVPYQTLPEGGRAQGTTAFTAKRTEHSRKPMNMHEMAEIVSPSPRLELFARPPVREGWDARGHEIEGEDLTSVTQEVLTQ